jgi:NAD(P)-dependent dehydrogenase (short-subunit alcohol dehydrogenase family)
MVKQALEESRGDLSGAASNKPTGAQEMVFGYKVDVSDRDEVFKVAGIMKEEVGVVDILVNNAGVVTGKHFLDTTDDENLRTMEINVISHFWVEIGALQFYSFQSHSITF